MPTPSQPGLFLLSPHFRIVWANERALTYFGWGRRDVLHRDMRALLRNSMQPVLERPDRFACALLASYADHRHLSERTCHVLPGEQRQERRLEYASRPIHQGKHTGGRVEHYLDVTEARRVPVAEGHDTGAAEPA